MENDTAKQLALPFIRTDSYLKHFIEKSLGKPVTLVLTENTTSMLAARIHAGVLRVRLHRMFLNADLQVMNEIVSFLKNRRGAMPCFRSFVRDNRDQISLKQPKKVIQKTAGRFHDLCALYDEINKEYFDNAITAAITWGTRSPRTAVRKRTVGSYSERSNLIRINPVLDKKTVPRSYVAFIVYHEMLHASMGISMQGKRRSVHSREFRKREKFFKEYEKVRAWEGGNI